MRESWNNNLIHGYCAWTIYRIRNVPFLISQIHSINIATHFKVCECFCVRVLKMTAIKNSFTILVLGLIAVNTLATQDNFLVGKTKNNNTQFEFVKKNAVDSELKYRLTEGALTVVKPFHANIQIGEHKFDPLSLPKNDLKSSNPKASLYLVQFFTQPTRDFQSEIADVGCTHRGFLPPQTIVVKCDMSLAQRLQDLDYVRAVLPYSATFKMSKQLGKSISGKAVAGAEKRYVVALFSREKNDLAEFAAFAKAKSIRLVSQNSLWGGFPEVYLDNAKLNALIEYDNVQGIEEWSAPELDMNVVRDMSGANYVQTEVPGYTGAGVTGEVVDVAMIRHASFKHIIPYGPSGLNSQDLGAYHGTQTFGVIFGDGVEDPVKKISSTLGKGLIPDATGVFSAENLNDYNRSNDLSDMVNPNGPYRVLFQSNSWGHATSSTYNIYSQLLDRAIYDHDVVVLQSMGNSGPRPEAWSKNVIAVGGVAGQHTMSVEDDKSDSAVSRGPSSSGRVKPDLIHFTDGVYAATSVTGGTYDYALFLGTSASTPIVAGHFGIMFQMWADNLFTGGYPGKSRPVDVFSNRPHAATAKALMINTANSYTFSGATADLNRYVQGWGVPNVKNLYDLAKNNNWMFPLIVDGSDHLKPLEKKHYLIDVNSGSFLKVTMAYMDPPEAISDVPINDLDLELVSPSGIIYRGNNGLVAGNWSTSGGQPDEINTVENVFIQNPEIGQWKISVTASRIYSVNQLQTDASYGLVASCGGKCSLVQPVTTPLIPWLIPVLNLLLFN